MSQKIFLFNDTNRNNILYSRQDVVENYEDISQKLAIDKIYERHNSDENMIIGENGVMLSGGEIQKIAITRALLCDEDIVIFDEANSNIDIETKRMLKEIISKELNDKLVIIIDHRDLLDDLTNKEIIL